MVIVIPYKGSACAASVQAWVSLSAYLFQLQKIHKEQIQSVVKITSVMSVAVHIMEQLIKNDAGIQLMRWSLLLLFDSWDPDKQKLHYMMTLH